MPMDAELPFRLVLVARRFAFEAHTGHTRKNKAKQPYVYHLEEVAGLVELSDGDATEIAAAWLHDVVEDTSVTISEVLTRFGTEVYKLVDGLTDPEEFTGLPLLRRKTLQAERISTMSPGIKRIKVCDQISNVRCVGGDDPPVGWDIQKCRDYVEGARRIVWKCSEVDQRLLALFNKVHADAVYSLR